MDDPDLWGPTMAINCPDCGAHFDVTLFQFDRRVRCDCGAWVKWAEGHVIRLSDEETPEDRRPVNKSCESDSNET